MLYLIAKALILRGGDVLIMLNIKEFFQTIRIQDNGTKEVFKYMKMCL